MKVTLLASFLVLFAAAFTSATAQVQVAPKVFLQGAYLHGGSMNTASARLYSSQIATLMGLQSLPPNVVDVVQVGLVRNQVVLHHTQAFVLANGNVVALDGHSPVLFPNVSPGAYQVLVGGRSGVPLLSATALSLSAESQTIDMTLPGNLSNLNQFEVRNGVALLPSGNLHNEAGDNGQINAMDLYYVYLAIYSGVSGYHPADVNLDGVVNATDLHIVRANNNALYSATVVFPSNN